MLCLMNLYFSIVRSCMDILFFSSNHLCLALVSTFQCIYNCFAELGWTGYFGAEGLWYPKESFFDDVLWMMNESEELCWILDICSDKWCIWIWFQNFLLGLIEFTLRISKSKVIVFQRSCKYGVFLELLVKVQTEKAWQSTPSAWSWKWLTQNSHE